jgi:GNAT superfamily N-acetyltransferase
VREGTVIIRPMQPQDAAAVVEMARELAIAVRDPEPTLDAGDLVRDGMGPERWFDCLVALVGGEVIGYAIMCRGYEAHTAKRRLWLGDLYVRKQARRAGVGRALMIAVADHAVAQGCKTVCWDLWRSNAAAKAFYQNLGAAEASDLAIWHLASPVTTPAPDLPTLRKSQSDARVSSNRS